MHAVSSSGENLEYKPATLWKGVYKSRRAPCGVHPLDYLMFILFNKALFLFTQYESIVRPYHIFAYLIKMCVIFTVYSIYNKNLLMT